MLTLAAIPTQQLQRRYKALQAGWGLGDYNEQFNAKWTGYGSGRWRAAVPPKTKAADRYVSAGTIAKSSRAATDLLQVPYLAGFL